LEQKAAKDKLNLTTKLLLNSQRIVESELDDNCIYLQVIDVKPYFAEGV
jgi:hypothetical protein